MTNTTKYRKKRTKKYGTNQTICVINLTISKLTINMQIFTSLWYIFIRNHHQKNTQHKPKVYIRKKNEKKNVYIFPWHTLCEQ